MYNPAIRVLEVATSAAELHFGKEFCRCKSWLQILICNFMVNMLMNNMWIVKVGRMIIIDETYLIWVTHFSVCTWFAGKSRLRYTGHNALPILPIEEKGKFYSRDMNTFMIDDNTQAVGMQQHLANWASPCILIQLVSYRRFTCLIVQYEINTDTQCKC